MAHKLESAHIAFGLVTFPAGIYSALNVRRFTRHYTHFMFGVPARGQLDRSMQAAIAA